MFSQYRGLRRENYILAFGRLVTGLGSMVWPMLTLILSQKMGVGAREISWVVSASMVLMAPAIFAGGKIADRWDKKRNIVILDVVSVVCYLICAFIPLSWATIVLMFIGSVGQNMENPSYNALTADITKTEDRERANSLQYMCANLGLVLAPTLAGLLFKNYLWLIFLLNGLSIGSSTSLIFFLVKDTTPVVETESIAVYQTDRSRDSLWKVLRENRVIVMFITAICGYYATYQMYIYLMPLDLAALHGDAGPVIYGSVTSLNCVVVVIFAPVVTKYFAGMAEPAKATLSQLLMLGGFLLFYVFLGHIPVYYISMALLTLGEVFMMIVENPYFTKRMPSSHRGRINGTITVIRTAVTSIYQLIIGAVMGGFGSPAAWTVVLIVQAAVVLFTWMICRHDRAAYPNLYEGDMSHAQR